MTIQKDTYTEIEELINDTRQLLRKHAPTLKKLAKKLKDYNARKKGRRECLTK